MTDEQLVQRLQSGEKEAVGELYDRYAPIILGILFKMVGNRAIAEELLQDTFWRVWNKADSFDPDKGAFRPWMFSIARRLAIDTLRRQSVRPQSMDDAYDDELLAQTSIHNDVADDVHLALERAAIRDALQYLPAEQRQVIELAYFGGKTRRAIADETRIPLGTVHTRARKGLQRLRAILIEREWGQGA